MGEINREPPGAREVFFIVTGVWGAQVHLFVKSPGTVYLRWGYFTAYICTFEKPNKSYTLNRTLQSSHLKVAWDSMMTDCSRITEYSCLKLPLKPGGVMCEKKSKDHFFITFPPKDIIQLNGSLWAPKLILNEFCYFQKLGHRLTHSTEEMLGRQDMQGLHPPKSYFPVGREKPWHVSTQAKKQSKQFHTGLEVLKEWKGNAGLGGGGDGGTTKPDRKFSLRRHWELRAHSANAAVHSLYIKHFLNTRLCLQRERK